jgi:predicted transcriptional regulator
MYKAYLSYAQLKEYLSMLIGNGLIEYIPEEQAYKMTEKGLKFQRSYEQMSNITGEMREITV